MYNDELRSVELEILMEKEDELMCDISLYNEQIIRLQMSLQKKEIEIEQYTEDYDILSLKVTKLKETLSGISKEINSRIKFYDDTERNIDDMGNEEFIEEFLEEYELDDFGLRGWDKYD